MISLKSYQKKQVEIFLWEPSGVDRYMYPITVGVPVPRGLLKNENRICLLEDERELPAAAYTTAKWEDGSIRWLLLDFQVDLDGNQKKKLLLKFNTMQASELIPNNPVKVIKNKEGLIVDNGYLKLKFNNRGIIPFNEVFYKDKSVLLQDRAFCSIQENGKIFHAYGDSVKVKLEFHNKFRAVIRCDGKFTAEDGSTNLDITTRVYFFAGKSFIRIYHTITNFEGRDVNIDDLSFNIPTKLEKVVNGYVTGNGVDDSIYQVKHNMVGLEVGIVPIPETKYDSKILYNHVGARERLGEIDGTMEQTADMQCLIRYGDGSVQKADGQRDMLPYAVSGLICGEGIRVALTCRNFYPQAPKKISVEENEISLNLYKNFDGKPLQFWRGTAKTHEIYLVIQEEGELEDRNDILRYKRFVLALEEPVAPTYGESSWLQKTEVFGPLLNYRPDKYPWLEFIFRRSFELWRENSASVLRGSTILDYGDSWNSSRGGQWQNNEMDFGGSLLLYMLRTGYPAPFPFAESAIHHMIDVDTHHDASNELWIGSQRYHQVRHGAFSSPTLCHEWLEGPLLFYLLTGYERAKEIAIMRANHFCSAIEAGWHRVKQLERIQGWPLVALSIMNEYFPNERYAKACNSILDWLEEWMNEDGDLVYDYMWKVVEGEKGSTILGRGVICQALAHYHRITGECRAWSLLVKLIEIAETKLFSPEGLGTKTSLLRRNYYAPGESDFVLEALGYLWEQTNDPKWMKLGLLNFKLALIQRDPLKGTKMGVGGNVCEIYRHWPPFLYYADESGLLEDIKIY